MSSRTTPLSRETLASRVRDYLLVEIANGRLAPGTRVRELSVAQELGTSQTPVREAFRELAAFGLLEARSHIGTRVREVSETELAQAVPVRAALESLAARTAAPFVAESSERLEAAYEHLVQTAGEGDRLQYCSASTLFHRELISSARNQPLLRSWNALGIEVLTIMSVLTSNESLEEMAVEHRQIVDVLAAGDAEAAAQLLEEHITAYIPRTQQPDLDSQD